MFWGCVCACVGSVFRANSYFFVFRIIYFSNCSKVFEGEVVQVSMQSVSLPPPSIGLAGRWMHLPFVTGMPDCSCSARYLTGACQFTCSAPNAGFHLEVRVTWSLRSLRERQRLHFEANEAVLVADIDIIDKGQGILEKELRQNPSSIAQLSGFQPLLAVQALARIADPHQSVADRNRLRALVQKQQYPDEWRMHADMLGDVSLKLQDSLDALRVAEDNAAHKFQLAHGDGGNTTRTESCTYNQGCNCSGLGVEVDWRQAAPEIIFSEEDLALPED